MAQKLINIRTDGSIEDSFIVNKSNRYDIICNCTSQGELKYVIEIGDIVKYPEKLDSDGDGNYDFNIGKKI